MAVNVMAYFGLLTIMLWLEKAGAICPDGFIPHNGKCYDLLPVQASWAEALHYCEIFGATLAVIENEPEQNFIAGMLSRLHDSIPSQHVWLGGTDLLEEGKFISPDSMVPLTYFKWAPTEPDNLNGQHCIETLLMEGSLMDKCWTGGNGFSCL
ncbi:hypothetical protein ACJMK2_036636 [Sinanodonta woodiana]|uniref:C-type lectin domain-containing protein n=1 Tax=Sinanodonta woodiana TaxID=1069815 RepID=A0ABD3WJP6_SINWO